MAELKAKKKHSEIGSGLELVEIEYSFAEDGGAVGSLDIIEFPEDMVVVDAWTKVKEACTSGGLATLIWGVKGGDVDACLDVTSGAVANLTLGAVIAGESASKSLKVAAGDLLEMTIGTEALTAGRVRFCMLLQKF